MNRRNFLKNTSLAGVSITTLSLTGCNGITDKEKEKNAKIDSYDFELDEVTIDVLQERMASGALTARQITTLYLDRIKKIDQSGPKLNAVIEINPDALAIADALDEERKQGKLRGPMHGIPVLIKDNIDTADKMQTTAGALALKGNYAKKDAFIVQQLRASGAILLGKTNLSEWANYRSTSSCSGWSSRGGQTKNPYILDHNPCGSSAGSGVAVAANLATVTIGTETDGSITCPASINNVVGLKPTVGLLSRSGIIPISHTQDTAGPMARTVRDAALLLGALTGVDVNDAVTSESQGKTQKDYTSFLVPNGLKGKKIGVDRKNKSSNQALNALLDEAITLMKNQGATIVEIDYLEKFNSLGQYESVILDFEFKNGVNAYLSKTEHAVKSLEAVIAFNIENEAKAMPYFKQELLVNANKRGDLQDPKYLEALVKGRDASRKILNDTITTHQLDAIAGITMGPACSIDVMYGDRWGSDFLTQPAAMSGFPHISLPCGFVERLPVGISFFSSAYSEPQLLSIAYAYEQASKKRKAPGFIKSFLE